MHAKRPLLLHLIAIVSCGLLLLTAPVAAESNTVAAQPANSHLMRGELRRFNSLRQAADAAFSRGRMAEAAELYREMLAVDPGAVYAQRRIGDCLLNQEQYDQAIAEYEKLAGMPATDAQSQEHKAAGAQLLELATHLQESLSPLPMGMSDAEKRAFSNQALREAEIHAELHDYGAALRAAAYAEHMGRQVGQPVSGDEYNDLIVEAVRYHLDAKNYAAVAALFEVADYLGIHSKERADLETEFTAATKGEVRKIQAAASPYLTALDQEVQERKAEDAKRDAAERRSRLAKITGAFTGLVSELIPLVGSQRARLAAAPATPPEGASKYVHRASRRVDYGKIVELNPADRVLYSLAPLTFYQSPGEWRAWASLRGYPPREPALPAQTAQGPFIVAREQDRRGVGWYYFLLDDPSDKQAQILGRYATPSDAEKALEYYIASDHNAQTGTITHD